MLIVLVLALLPVVVLLAYIYFRDKFQKEPARVLAKAFLGGLLAAVAVIVVMSPFPQVISPNAVKNSFYSAFCLAALPEELFKFLFLYWFIWKNPAFDEYFDGIVYAVFVSLGFAALENVMYVFNNPSVAFSRAIFSIPGHFLFGVIMGYYFSLAKFRPQRRLGYLLASYLVAVLAHGIYDLLCFVMEAASTAGEGLSILFFFLFIAFDVLLWVVGVKRIKKMGALHICPSCHAELRGNASYCMYCGTRLSDNTPRGMVRCPRCHALCAQDAKVCATCGTMLHPSDSIFTVE